MLKRMLTTSAIANQFALLRLFAKVRAGVV